MAILYRIIANNPNKDTIENWPPQIKESDRYTQLTLKMHDTSLGAREAFFPDVTAFETWVNANRLTDSELIAVFNEWKSTHSISFTEEFYEIPNYTPGVPSIFG